MKSYSPPRDVTIEVNGGGNGWSATTGFRSDFCPSYMNNSTYGGGMDNSGTSKRPFMCIWNQNVTNREIALFTAYYNQFGPDTPSGGIYRWDPFQEMSIDATSYSPSALLSVWPSLMAGIRNAAPKCLIHIKPTFINPNNGSSYPTILSNAFNNSISMASEDCSGSGHDDWGQTAYLGGWAGFATTNYTTNNGGNPGWDFHINVDPAELWNNSGNGLTPIPPASHGSGYIYDVTGNDIWTKAKIMKATHVDIYVDGYGGPNVNRRTYSASAPANPPLGPGAGLVAAHPNIIDVLTENTTYSGIKANGTAIPWTTYPSSYPTG
jgi:hypothetical protein